MTYSFFTSDANGVPKPAIEFQAQNANEVALLHQLAEAIGGFGLQLFVDSTDEKGENRIIENNLELFQV